MAGNTRDETIRYNFDTTGKEKIDAVSDSLEKTEKKSEGAGTAFEFLKEHMAEIVSAAAAVELAFKGIEFGTESIKHASEVEASLSRVKALAQGAAVEFEGMDEAIDKAARAVNEDGSFAASGLAALVSNGLAAKDAIDALTPSLQLAKIANIDVSTAAAEVAQQLKAFDLPGSEAQRIVDQLTAASHGAAGGLGGMSNAAAQLAPDAKALGLNFTDTVSILGLLSSKGLDAEKAVRGLRGVFQQLQDPASNLRGELLALGDGTSDFGKAVGALTSGTPRATQALLTLDGPARSLVEVLGQAGPDAIAKFNAGLQQTQGLADKTTKAIDENLRGSVKRFTLAIDDIGEKLAGPVLKPFADELSKLAGQLNEFADSPDFKEIQEAIRQMATQAAKALDEFITNVKWGALAKDGKAAINGLADDFETLAANAKSTAEGINAVFASLGVAYHGVRGTIDGVVGAVSAADAAVVDAVRPLAEEFDRVAHTGGLVTEGFDVMSNVAHSLADNALDQLDEQTTALTKNLHSLGLSSDDAAGATKRHGEAAKGAAPNVEAHAQASAQLGEALVPLPDYLGKAAGSADDLAAATKTVVPYLAALSEEAIHLGGGPLTDARNALAAATRALADLQLAGNATKEEMAAASQAFVDASHKLDQLQKSGTGAAEAITTALQKLHVTSQAELTQSANDFKTYFETVKAGSDQSAAAIANTQNAFLAYAKARLAATAQLDAAARASAQAELESQAAVLGVTGALADLEAQSASSANAVVSDADRSAAALQREGDASDHLRRKLGGGTSGGAGGGGGEGLTDSLGSASDATRALEEDVTRYGDATSKAALATQGITADTSHANEAIGELNSTMANMRIELAGISEAAAKAFDKRLLQDFNGEFDSAGTGLEKFAAALADAYRQTKDEIAGNRIELQGMIDATNRVGTESVADFGKLAGVARYTESQLGTMINSIENGTTQIGLLGQQELQPLLAALTSAKQRVDALKAAAQQATAELADLNGQLQDQLDQQNNNQTAIENRSFETQKKHIEDLAAQADAVGKAQAADALAKLNELHAAKLKAIADEAAAQQKADQQTQQSAGGSAAGSGGGATSSGNAGGAIPASVEVTHKVQLSLDGAGWSNIANLSQEQIQGMFYQFVQQLKREKSRVGA
ncbi:MAG TPA: phage tail tape measure protein [Rudaea sp.]|nr:phage tail tape measure protein [Rudaea sp.]